MPTANEANTPATEQRSIPELDTEDQALALQAEADVAPVAPEPDDKPVSPVDARAAVIEGFADDARDRAKAELEDEASHMERPAAAEPSAPDPDARVTLKVRGQNIGLTTAQRDEIAAAHLNVDADGFAAVSERDRNNAAQIAIAMEQMGRELADTREALKAAKVEKREPAAIAQPTPAPAAAPETPDAKRARALGMIQLGGDVQEANALLSEAEDERIEARLAEREQRASATAIDQAYENDISNGRRAAAEAHSAVMQDVLSSGVVDTLNATMQKALIARAIADRGPDVQAAFAGNGITADTLRVMSGDQVSALYKDMTLKRYGLPRPSAVFTQAAKVIADRLSGATPPPAGQHPGPDATTTQPSAVVDRSGRKDALTQPERASIPRPGTARPAAPRSERQRAANAFEETRAARLKGAPVRG